MVSSQPADRQAQLSVSLQRLMAEVQRNLEPKNRDKFTQVRCSCPCFRLCGTVKALCSVAVRKLRKAGLGLGLGKHVAAASLLSSLDTGSSVSVKGTIHMLLFTCRI